MHLDSGVVDNISTPCLADAARAKVSILIPCFNAERWIASAIRSALAQTWPNKEVIVVDDGSTDGSFRIIKSFGEAIRFETGPNRGGNVARNRLLELSDGDWLQYLDADDYLLPAKIERQFAEFDMANTDVAYSPIILEHWSYSAAIGQQILPIPEPHDPWYELVRWILPQTGSPLWRRSAVKDVGAWKADQRCCQEHELYLRLLAAGKRFQFCPTPGALYRQWSDQTVCRKSPRETLKMRLSIIDAAERHLNATGELIERRRDGIAHARLECARSMYQFDCEEALRLAQVARGRHPAFRLPAADCFPPMYRWVFHQFGFPVAEAAAAFARVWRRPSST